MRRTTRRSRRNIGTSRHKLKPLVKGVRILTPLVIKSIDNELDDNELDDNVKLTCMSNIKNRAKAARKGQRLTVQDAKMILEAVRNER